MLGKGRSTFQLRKLNDWHKGTAQANPGIGPSLLPPPCPASRLTQWNLLCPGPSTQTLGRDGRSTQPLGQGALWLHHTWLQDDSHRGSTLTWLGLAMNTVVARLKCPLRISSKCGSAKIIFTPAYKNHLLAPKHANKKQICITAYRMPSVRVSDVKVMDGCIL